MPKKNDETEDEGAAYFANYLLENFNVESKDYQSELDGNLGLAFEKLPNGVSRKSLWSFNI